MTQLPTEYQSYYVYFHVDPITQDVVYVGKGKETRAWAMGTYKLRNKGQSYGHRTCAHNEWMCGLVALGYLPCDWVRIVHRNLTKSQALGLEKSLTAHYRPQFNAFNNPDHSFKDAELVKCARALRNDGLTYKQIARELGVATMTVWRAIND